MSPTGVRLPVSHHDTYHDITDGIMTHRMPAAGTASREAKLGATAVPQWGMA